MNTSSIASIIRHWITAGVGVLSLWIIAFLVLSVDEAKQLTAAFEILIEPLVVILGLIAVALSRLVIAWLGNIFRRGAGEIGDRTSGIAPLLWIGTAAALLGGLPSCSFGEYPLTGTISYRDPNSGAKGGLTFSPGVAPRATLKVPIYDPQSGEMIGLADLQAELPVERTSSK